MSVSACMELHQEHSETLLSYIKIHINVKIIWIWEMYSTFLNKIECYKDIKYLQIHL